MTEARDHFAHLETLDAVALAARAEAIKADPTSYSNEIVGDFTQLNDEPLSELFHITRLLRKKAATRSGTSSTHRKPKAATTLEDLA